MPPGLFISYARKDGTELATRLHQDLRQHGYDSWLDRPGIRAGEGWALAIEQAIDGSDGLLALLTQGSYTSQICRGEHGRALRKGKFVIPLLVQPDADRPVYLEQAHYLDFTRPDDYPRMLKALVAELRAHRGTRWESLSERDRARLADEEERARVAEPLASWANLCARSVQQMRKTVADLTGTETSPGIVMPDLYVDRADAEAALERFLGSDDLALVLAGDSGTGKTTLLCRWARQLTEAGHAVLLYNGVSLLDPDVGQILCQDLSVEDVAALPHALTSVEDLAQGAGRKMVVILDAINDFRGRQGADTTQLLRLANDLVDRLPGRSLRVVLCCSGPTWHRLERHDVLRQLHWSRFHRPEGDDRPLTLGVFTPAELEAAYARYRERFALGTTFDELPPRVRAVVREPLLLRLLAESYAGKDEPITEGALDVGVYRRYWEQRIRRPTDQHLVEELVAAMYERRRATLFVHDLARHETLGPEILREEGDSAFHRLLEQGVLTLTRGDLFVGDSVRFTHPAIGAYALARHLLGAPGPVSTAVTTLVTQADTFPLAWDAAQAMLLVHADPETFAELAASTDPEKRELVAEALCRLHAVRPDATGDILRQLMDGDSEEACRTALRAAYSIGPGTRELFLRAAMRGSPALRQAAKDTLYLIWRQASRRASHDLVETLYLIWRHDAGFTYGVLGDLVERVRLRDLASLRNTIEFVLDVSITIYINHPDQPEVVRNTAALYDDLLIERLHLDRVPGGPIVDMAVGALAARFSEPILKWMLFTDTGNVERVFQIPRSARAPLLRLSGTVDPARPISSAREDVKDLLERDVPFFNGAAAFVLAVHACADFPAVEPLHRELFAELTPHGRLWQLLGFAVLLPDTPPAWKELLEDFTRRILDEHRDPLQDETAADLLCVPLGLAYGKRGEPMRLYDEWLRDGLARGDAAQVRQVLVGLGPVGFYFPDVVFATLRPLVADLVRGPHQQELSTTLAIIRTLHFDAVDGFLAQSGVEEAFRRRVSVAADVALVHGHIQLLGFYNNAVHLSLHYPRMRRVLSAGALALMAEAETSRDFVRQYTKDVFQLARETGFHILEWTRPEKDSLPSR